MKKKLKTIAVIALAFMIPSVATAACSGYVVTTGCNRCGFLYLEKYKYKRVTYYNSNPDGSCRTSSSMDAGDCKTC